MNYYRPIKEIFDFEKGSLQSSKAIDGEYNFITASSEWKKHNIYEHDKEALIIAVAASGSLGRVHYINGKFISSDLCFILTPRNQKKIPVDLQFYQHFFQSIRHDLVQATATGTSKLAINQENFGNYKVPYFDIEHQKKYKEKFVTLEERQFKLNSQFNQQKTNLKNLRKQILQDAIEGKLTKEWREKNPDIEPASELLKKIKKEKEKLISEKKIKKEKPLPEISKSEIPFELPKSWVWTIISEIGLCFTGDSINESVKNLKYKVSKNGLNYIGTKDVGFECSGVNYNTGVVIPFDESGTEFKIAKKGSIFICIEGGSSGKKMALIDQDVCFGNKLLATQIFKSVSYEYVYFVYQTFLFENEFKNKSKGLRGGVSVNVFKSIKIPLPPLPEQLAIVSKLQTLMQKIDEVEKQIEKNLALSKQLSKAILAEAFNQNNLEKK